MNAPAKAAPQRKSTAQKVSAKAARQHGKPAAAPQSPDVALPEPPAKKKASRAKKAPTAATSANLPREGSKNARVIAMLRREGGATLEEISSAMGWQPHTTRSLMSAGGSLAK